MGIPESKYRLEKLRNKIPLAKCNVRNRFVAFCDVLGFRELINNNNLKELSNNYAYLIREAKAYCIIQKKYPSKQPWKTSTYKPDSVIFSDSILIWSSPLTNNNELNNEILSFFPYLSAIFSIALKLDFPLRIGIAYDECVIEPKNGIFLGNAIVNAYLTEQAQDWVGVACHPTCFNHPKKENLVMEDINGRQSGSLIEYNIPIKTKSNQLELKHTIDWPFWGFSDWGGEKKLKVILEEKVNYFENTDYYNRWKSALDYFNFRNSIWEEIDKTFRK